MVGGKALSVQKSNDHLELAAYDVTIRLERDEADLLLSWLRRSLSMTVTELFKVAYPGAEMEVRNYNDHFDFIMFVHKEGELNARVLFLGKDEAPALIESLARELSNNGRQSPGSGA